MDNRPIRVNDLHDIIDQKITAVVRDMENADWSEEEVILAINDVIKSRWLDRLAPLGEASRSMPSNFISDGNEG